MILYLFSQFEAANGNEGAQGVLQNSLNISQGTFESWNRIWDLTVSTESTLWQSLADLGAFLAAMSIVYLAIKEANANSLTYRRLVTISQMPLAVIFFLAGNAKFLVDIVRAIRAIALFWLRNILELSLADISISEALQKLQNTNVANGRAREIFSECLELTGTQLQDCIQDPVKVQQAQQIFNTLNSGNAAPIEGNILQRVVGGIVEGAVNLAFDETIGLIQIFLGLLQWAFLNGIEAALILTALFAPIALGFSMMPSAGPTIFKWFSGYIALFLAQLGYVIIIGFTALVLALSENSSQSFGTLISDFGFLLFLALVAPIMAMAVSKGMGEGIFSALSRSTQAGLSAATSLARVVF